MVLVERFGDWASIAVVKYPRLCIPTQQTPSDSAPPSQS